MIRYLVGTILEIREKEVILLTSGGVGYQVFPCGSLLSLIKVNSDTAIYIVTIVKETEISLYGFANTEEQKLFEKLISVSGIGPKTALQMASIPTGQFLQAINNGDVAFLTKIPGLGKKTAERLIIELRGKINLTVVNYQNAPSQEYEEAQDALHNLGYDTSTIHAVLESAPKESSAEELVKFFLSQHH